MRFRDNRVRNRNGDYRVHRSFPESLESTDLPVGIERTVDNLADDSAASAESATDSSQLLPRPIAICRVQHYGDREVALSGGLHSLWVEINPARRSSAFAMGSESCD